MHGHGYRPGATVPGSDPGLGSPTVWKRFARQYSDRRTSVAHDLPHDAPDRFWRPDRGSEAATGPGHHPCRQLARETLEYGGPRMAIPTRYLWAHLGPGVALRSQRLHGWPHHFGRGSLHSDGLRLELPHGWRLRLHVGPGCHKRFDHAFRVRSDCHDSGRRKRRCGPQGRSFYIRDRFHCDSTVSRLGHSPVSHRTARPGMVRAIIPAAVQAGHDSCLAGHTRPHLRSPSRQHSRSLARGRATPSTLSAAIVGSCFSGYHHSA